MVEKVFGMNKRVTVYSKIVIKRLVDRLSLMKCCLRLWMRWLVWKGAVLKGCWKNHLLWQAHAYRSTKLQSNLKMWLCHVSHDSHLCCWWPNRICFKLIWYPNGWSVFSIFFFLHGANLRVEQNNESIRVIIYLRMKCIWAAGKTKAKIEAYGCDYYYYHHHHYYYYLTMVTHRAMLTWLPTIFIEDI